MRNPGQKYDYPVWEMRRLATPTDYREARERAFMDVKSGKKSAGPKGWIDRRAWEDHLADVVQQRFSNRWIDMEEKTRREVAAREKARADHLASLLSQGPIGRLTVAGICKGCSRVYVPPEAAAVSSSGGGRVVALNSDGDIIAAWDSRANGPYIYSFPISIEDLTIGSFRGWYRPE